MIRSVVVGVFLASIASVAQAGPRGHHPYLTVPGHAKASSPGVTHTLSNQVLFINRCEGGCNLRPGADDPASGLSELVQAPVTIPEFAWAPGEWEAIMQCVKEVYSPYNVMVTDTRPTIGLYNETVVGGSSQLIGIGDSCGVGEIGDGACGPNTQGIAFAFTGFAESSTGCLDDVSSSDDGNPVWGMCFVIAQESAHNYGLDHEIMFLDGTSACSDPMSYQTDCGGEKFFRNQFAHCSANLTGDPKPWCGIGAQCGATQNSHQRLLAALGPGTPITTPPVVTLVTPVDGATVASGSTVHATASAQRGIASTELWLNGYKWATAPAAAFGRAGQPASDYAMTIPDDVPDSVLDVVVKAFDDILVETDTPVITVTKGKAGGCDASKVNADGSIDTCAVGQKCQPGGKCAWDAPVGQLGDDCTFPQFCASGVCQGTSGQQFCTEQCFVSIADACPMGFECVMTDSNNNGICLRAGAGAGGGGCSTVGHSETGALVAQGGLALGALAVVFRRRRRPTR